MREISLAASLHYDLIMFERLHKN